MEHLNIPHGEQNDLLHLMDTIHDTYINGNKNTAREMLNIGIPESRKAYAGMALYIMGVRNGTEAEMRQLIVSATT